METVVPYSRHCRHRHHHCRHHRRAAVFMNAFFPVWSISLSALVLLLDRGDIYVAPSLSLRCTRVAHLPHLVSGRFDPIRFGSLPTAVSSRLCTCVHVYIPPTPCPAPTTHVVVLFVPFSNANARAQLVPIDVACTFRCGKTRVQFEDLSLWMQTYLRGGFKRAWTWRRTYTAALQ